MARKKRAGSGLFSMDYLDGNFSFLNGLPVIGPLVGALTPIKEAEGKTFTALAYSPTGTTMASGEEDGTVRIGADGTFTSTELNKDGDRPNPEECKFPSIVSLSRTDYYLLVAYQCGVIQAWDMSASRPVASATGSDLAPSYVVISQDGTRVAARLSPIDDVSDPESIKVWAFDGESFSEVYP